MHPNNGRRYIKGVGGSIPLTDIFDGQYSLEKWAQEVLASLLYLGFVLAAYGTTGVLVRTACLIWQVLGLPDGHAPLVHSISCSNDETHSALPTHRAPPLGALLSPCALCAPQVRQ